jgi:hypothetical protein
MQRRQSTCRCCRERRNGRHRFRAAQLFVFTWHAASCPTTISSLLRALIPALVPRLQDIRLRNDRSGTSTSATAAAAQLSTGTTRARPCIANRSLLLPRRLHPFLLRSSKLRTSRKALRSSSRTTRYGTTRRSSTRGMLHRRSIAYVHQFFEHDMKFEWVLLSC